MKGLVLEPTIADEKVLVQFSAEISVDKHVSVKAPKGYQAVVIVDEKAIARVAPCTEKKIIEYGKQWLNKKARVAFVRSQVSSDMAWGFGNIRVNNERLQEAYTVGANGKYSVEITEVGKLLNGFSGEENVTTDIIREKTIATVKNIGTSVLAKYFANTDTSIFEISAHTTEIRKEMIAALKDETAFNTLGIKLNDLTVEGIHIPEEDLTLIKNRINANSEVAVAVQVKSENNTDFDDAILKITEKLNSLEENLKKYGETQVDKTNDFNALKGEIEQALADRLAENSADLQEKIESVISEKVSEEASMWKDTLLAGLDERLQNAEKSEKPQTATEYSAESLISGAQKEMDYVLAASMIYTCVEERLIKEFHLQHQNKKFVIPYTEYLELADTATINGEYILKRKTINGYEPLQANVEETYNDGTPKLVEMFPVVRFLKAGLSPIDAKRAEKISVVINKIRHNSPENQEFLQRFFAREKKKKKEFLLEALEFLKEKNLYIEK